MLSCFEFVTRELAIVNHKRYGIGLLKLSQSLALKKNILAQGFLIWRGAWFICFCYGKPVHVLDVLESEKNDFHQKELETHTKKNFNKLFIWGTFLRKILNV